jgi:hypothetical protein
MKLNREAFAQIVAEDRIWLERHSPDTLERRHIDLILEESVDRYYPREASDLVRLRADPKKVRVTVQRSGRTWTATVGPRPGVAVPPAFGCVFPAVAFDDDPKTAVQYALELAEARNLPGVDLGCDWAYPHPHGVEAAKRANASAERDPEPRG